MTIRDEQKERRRGEILRAGLDLFVKRGYTAAKVKDIADAVGMSVGLLFHYFPSKEELYRCLVEYGVSAPMNAVLPAAGEPLTFFSRAAKEVLDYAKQDAFTAKMFLFMNQALMSEDVPPSAKEVLSGFDVYTPTAAMIRAGQQTGSIRAGDAMALAEAFWCAISGIAQMIACYPDLPMPESEWIVDIIRNHEKDKNEFRIG